MVVTSGSAQAKQVVFPEESYPDSQVSVERTWVIKVGDHPVLEGTLTIRRGIKAATIDEVLPAGLDGHITTGAAVSTTADAHILRYEIAPGRDVLVVKYQVDLAEKVANQAAVQAFAVQQIQASGANYRASHKLTRVWLDPSSYSVAPGGQ